MNYQDLTIIKSTNKNIYFLIYRKMEEELKAFYYDPKTGYVSATALHKKLKGKYTLAQVK